MTTQWESDWVCKLRTILKDVRSGKLSPRMAIEEVRDAYEIFLRVAYETPRLWKDKEAERLWTSRPDLGSPAAELRWWAQTMQNRARGGKRTFFHSPVLWAAIEEILVRM